MAPAIVVAEQTPASAYGRDLLGPKEAFIGGPQAYDRIVEEKGDDKQPPATHPNYLPVWDEETKYAHLHK